MSLGLLRGGRYADYQPPMPPMARWAGVPDPSRRPSAGGRSIETPFAALAWTDRPAISFQFHPEFTPAYAKALIDARRDRMPDADARIATLDAPNDTARVGSWIRRFLTQAD